MKLSSSSLILAVALATSYSSLADTWTDPETGRTWSYRMLGDTAEISPGEYSDWTGDLTIPAKI